MFTSSWIIAKRGEGGRGAGRERESPSGSQQKSIMWNNTKFTKGQNPDEAALRTLIGRLVLAHTLVEHVLRPSAVSEALCVAFIDDVMDGRYHDALDGMFKCALEDEFRVQKARQALAQRLPFLEAIINQSTNAEVDEKAGFCKLEHIPDTDFRTKFIPNLSRYVKDCMSPMVRALASVQNRRKDEHVCIYSVLYVCSCTYVCLYVCHCL